MFHLRQTADEDAADEDRRKNSEAINYRDELREKAELTARCKKAEARIAWLERPVTEYEIRSALIAYQERTLDHMFQESRCDINVHEKSITAALAAALKIRIAP